MAIATTGKRDDEREHTDPLTAPAPDPGQERTPNRSFFLWAGGVFLVVLAVLVGLSLRLTDGRFAYVLDDGAIHISVGRTLAHHLTWGVQPGVFESASSPVWTVLVAITTLFPGGTTWGPLVLNIAAGLAALWVLGRAQQVIDPGPRRKLDIAAVVVLVTVLLFLPSLAMTGMEHLLHLAITIAAVWLFHRRTLDEGPRQAWLPYLLLGVAVLVRFESLFLAVGIGVALLAGSWRPLAVGEPAPRRDRFRMAVLVGVAAAVPFIAFSAFNFAMGGELLPNSVIAKTVLGQGLGGQKGLRGYAERLTTDSLLAALVVLALGYLVFAATGSLGGERRRRAVFPAVAFVVTVGLHLAFAQIGWFERYQEYLIGLGLLTALSIAAAVLPREARRVAPALLCVAVLLAPVKWQLLVDTPTSSDNSYRQRYQAGKFLDRYYRDRPVATGELGYISLFHEGSVTDLFGLGDTEVLKARVHNRDTKAFWSDLARRRGFRVAAVYPSTLLFHTPDQWILVGTWRLNEKRITAYESNLQFWATTPDEVDPLKAHLKAFERSLPRGVTTSYNAFAELRRDKVRAELGATKPGG